MLGLLSEFDDLDDQPTTDPDGRIHAVLIPLRDLVLFPRMVTPLFIGRPGSLQAVATARQENLSVICAAQIDGEIERPKSGDIYRIGVEVSLGRHMQMPDGSTSILTQARRRVEIMEFVEDDPIFRVVARPIEDETSMSDQIEASMRTVRDLFEQCVELNRSIPEEAYIYAINIDDPGWLADLVVSTLDIDVAVRQELLETFNPVERLFRVSVLLQHELDLLELESQIHDRVQDEVDRSQREAFLREQMRVIQTELGESDFFQQEITQMRERLMNTIMPAEVRNRGFKELHRLQGMPPLAPEVGIIRSYVEWLLDLPWSEETEDQLDVPHVAKILDDEHYGLRKAKDRVLEHIAVKRLAGNDVRTPILCLVGPPGTGKTSLGKSIAHAIGRKFARISLGGVRDEAEIRGHRRTYIGALPGRIIQTMRRAGTINPLFMLDEIDKLGADYRGDPSSALLEVLDPEQNFAFSDHYLEVDYDLSKVMFITTANDGFAIPAALRDRLEIIEFPSYISDEKQHIAQRFLIPKQIKANGLQDQGIRFDQAAIDRLIDAYTYEAGVRNLEREIANICRKIARRVAAKQSFPKRVTSAQVEKLLGPPKLNGPLLLEQPEIGTAMGVAWTEVGGDVFQVEVSLLPGKGNLMLTGQLGEVMQESAQAALSTVRVRGDDIGLDSETLEATDIHVHLPEGAIPKDGPSAGITLAVAVYSAFSEQPVRHDMVMTGEITLRGRVLPVGGIKEKLVAAYRAGLRTFLMPKKNEKDLIDIPKRVRREMTILMAETIDEVLEFAILPEEAEDAEEAEDRPIEDC
ncbi:MAG: endopeptidase La [Chloroflexi bacterium]|nr:endopeptidase La [Chloroflexota bacterium]